MKRLTLSLCVFACLRLNAGTLASRDAVDAIVGESAGQPYAVKLGIADALRNRGSKLKHPLRGVYGFHARHNAGEPARVWNDARRAWTESATVHPVKGAQYFGNADDVRKGTFAGMTLTAVIGTGKDATYFFKS
jgi:hypothetical protein